MGMSTSAMAQLAKCAARSQRRPAMNSSAVTIQ